MKASFVSDWQSKRSCRYFEQFLRARRLTLGTTVAISLCTDWVEIVVAKPHLSLEQVCVMVARGAGESF